MQDKGQNRELRTNRGSGELGDLVLDKSIFSNIFDKDIRRVYLYKKAERLAKAIHLIAPAFSNAPALRERLEDVAIGLIDAAILPPPDSRDELSRELLTLSSILGIARSGGILSTMNADLIAREAHSLLQEVASYEEPHLLLDEMPSLATLARDMHAQTGRPVLGQVPAPVSPIMRREVLPKAKATDARRTQGQSQGQVSDKGGARRDAILSVLRTKGPSYIKDISTVVRGVSEKTIQRELQALVESGKVTRTGERRWTTYSLTS
jgi:DNA-binding transcriptional ArsR family regulator